MPRPDDESGTKGLDELREVGPYKVLDVLGEGGMGVVYLAEQMQPLRRRVALKVLKRGMDTRQIVARFDSERQALAVMDHPHIARVLDSGVTPDGRPFFVMELVQGVPITQYADTHRLTTDERLRLFIDVCRAVQHAHHKGVIHRDLKPSNVLVAMGDGVPTVKVIDFGIAKAIGMSLTERTLVTHIGQMIGTPEYMSPEQAEMSGLDVDTRTDIYSLGVMLYELVVGVLPFELRSKPDYAIPQTLRERDVPRPSTRLTTLGEALETVARHRRTTPDLLRRELRGDLDWIILRAMEKDRTRRYETATELALDLERHLADEPVIARPPSTSYRLGKFVRRNRAPVGAALVAVFALLAGAAAATAGFVQARAEQRRAEASAATAQQVSDFLVDIFRVSNPDEARGDAITAREVLDRGADRIRGDLAGQPTVQARLMRVIGTVYQQLGLYDEAAPLLEEAVAIAERAPDPIEAQLPESLRQLGILYGLQRNTQQSDATLRRALALYREHHDTASADLARILNSLGAANVHLGRFDDATGFLRAAVTVQEHTLGPEHAELAGPLSNLGVVYLNRLQLDSAHHYLSRAASIRERTFGADSPQFAETLSNLGATYQMTNRYEEAEAAYTRVFAIWRSTLGEEHPRMGPILNNLGEIHAARGRPDQAEEFLLRSLDLKERTHGPTNVSLVTTLASLAGVYVQQQRLSEADVMYRRAVAIHDAADDVSPLTSEKLFGGYARLLRSLGHDGEADAMDRRLAELAQRR
jgi:eukaryotic-like serine/threonine-protein kinase